MVVRTLIAIVVMMSASVAHANGVVLESYTGDRPADAPRLLAPVLEELAKRKYDTGDTVARTYDSQVSRAAQTAKGMPSDFAAQIDTGFKAWVQGRFGDAIKILVPLVEMAHNNSGEIAKNPALRDPLLKGLIALAIAHQRNGDLEEMRANFGEVIRAFPEAQVSRGTYGADAATAFEQVKKDTVASGKGKLTLKLADDTAVVFIDEAYRAVGSTSVDLFPGEYRVVVMLNKQPSRSHIVAVRANTESTIEIDPRLDQSIRTVGYTGLSFTKAEDRNEYEAQYAAKFANAIGANAVAVIGIDKVNGKSAVVGTLVSLQSGREIRRASIPVEPDPSTERLRALARFLGGEDAAPGLEVKFSHEDDATAPVNTGHGHEERPESTAAAGRGGRWGGWRFITAGLAVAGLAGGGYATYLDGRCNGTPPIGMACRDLYATQPYGYLGLGAGAVFAGISIYLFATHDSGAYVVPSSNGGAVAGYSLRF